MEVKLRNVGNSVTATIPKAILEQMGMKAGDTVEFQVLNDYVTMRQKKKKLKGEIYLEKLFGKSMDEIEEFDTEMMDMGAPVGEEIW